ncbi:MAG: peptidase dipeptidylpeptidase domain protein [Candidatus Acidoferrum typicum]|nr:peptidase dipeptidylpeptidase domain protein [Candidatus Acidoferrum typicum]
MRRLVDVGVACSFLLLVCAGSPLVCLAQQQPGATGVATPASSKPLTVDRIYSEPSLSGRLTRGIAWTRDSKQISFFESNGTGKAGKTELWAVDVASGQRRVLLSAEKLESVLPADAEQRTQATGLGRHPPAEYQWAPGGGALLFQGPTSLAWFDLKTQVSRTVVSGKESIADPKISPDGRYVSFVRSHNLWLVSVADGKERAFTEGGTEEVRKGELDWVYPEELEITTAYWWAPDSSAIAYFEMNERKVAKYPLVDFTSPAGEAEEERYPPAGGGNPIVRVFVAPVGGGEAHAMDTGENTDIYIARVNWLTDSKHVAIQRLNRQQTILDLLISDAATGQTRTPLTEQDQYWINVNNDLRFLKDGKRFLWASERSGYRHLYLYDLEGKQLAQITKGEWEVSGVDAVDEGKGVVYFTGTAKSPLERHLYRVSLDGSAISRITIHNGTHGVNMAPDASAFVDTYSDVMTPLRQDVARADGSLLRVINENKDPELGEYHLSAPQFLSVKAHDGMPLNAAMIKPPDFDSSKKYPVLIFTYGGPHAQVVSNAWGGSTGLWHQLMAQKGYIIFALDNRGSGGRGHVFEEPIHFRLGAQELSDQLDGVTYLKSLPYVDAERIGIWGWSYGGHMTLHAIFETGSVFKAGFAGGPVTDWHFYDSIYTERYLGLLPQNELGYRASSPINEAEKLKGKLLIAHGTGDDNVHFANTLSLIDRLIELQKYVEVMPFPGRGHGVSDPAARKVLMNRVTQFFLDNL